MGKSYHRNFRKGGKRFYAADCPKQDKREETDRYYLLVMHGGHYRVVHDHRYNVPHFATLEEAQRYAFLNAESVCDYLL